MVSSLIVFFLSILSLGFFILTQILLIRRDFISYEIEHGIICSSCKDTIDYDEYLTQWPPSSKREHCLRCKRDEVLGDILDKKHKHNLLNYVYSKNWKYTFIYLSIISIIIQFSSIIFHTSYLDVVGSSLLVITHFLNFKNFMYMTRPKKTQSK